MIGTLRFPSLWFPALILVSLGVHGSLLAWVRWETTAEVLAEDSMESFLEVEIVEELPPEPEPEPEPEVIVEEIPPEPEPPMEDPMIEEVVEELPEPEPETTPQPKPTPAQPKPTPVVNAAPKPRPVTAPRPAPPRAPILKKAAPEVHRNPPPQYPSTARRNNWQGRVVVRAAVNAVGRVESVSIFRSSGHAILDQAALDAVRRWRFRPGTRNGEPVPSTVEVPVNFQLQ